MWKKNFREVTIFAFKTGKFILKHNNIWKHKNNSKPITTQVDSYAFKTV